MILFFNNNKLSFFIYVFLLNIFTHFIPFERMSFSPDNYALLGSEYSLKNFFYFSNRPLSFIFIEIQNSIIFENSYLNILLIFFSSLLTIYIAFYLLNLFFKHKVSFFIIIIYSLLFSKLEIFHSSIMVNINIVSSLYLLSLILFINYINEEKKLFLVFSLLFYSISIFWYEIGILFPFLFFIYAYIFNNNKKLLIIFFKILPFLLILLLYLSYRFTGAFGYGEIIQSHSISINLIPSGIIEILNHFVGRYFIRNFVYGIYVFLNIDPKWLYLLLIADLLLIIIFLKIFLNYKSKFYFNKRYAIFFICLFFISVLPVILNGSSAGRHLIIPSISFCIFILYLLSFTKKYYKYFYIFFFIIGIVVCQGNAWAQIISSRINNAVHESLLSHKNEILKYKNLVIDTNSFANNINHTFFKRDYNKLNTYYGAQTFEDWGLNGMVDLTINNIDLKTYISISEIKNIDSNIIFFIKKNISYKNFSKKKIEINKNDSFILDYEKVYYNGYNYGK
jgi:hypothetical protein